MTVRIEIARCRIVVFQGWPAGRSISPNSESIDDLLVEQRERVGVGGASQPRRRRLSRTGTRADHVAEIQFPGTAREPPDQVGNTASGTVLGC